MMPGVFLHVPAPLLLFALADYAAAGVLPPSQPRQWSPLQAVPLPAPLPPAAVTVTAMPHSAQSVAPQPRPTGKATGATALHELRRRYNTVCGYIGGNSALAATCLAGSHCVLDTEHSVVGCCPDDSDTCTAGVYTGCVDSNSGSQTEANPYVYTCTGENVCYKNDFGNGYSQYGCGTDSAMGTSVALSASGMSSALDLSTISDAFTGSFASSTSSTSSSSSSSTSSASSTSSTSASSTSTSSTSSAASASSSAANADSSKTKGGSSNRTGVIIGATISSVAVLVAVMALLFFCRKRQRNQRKGPGPKGISPSYISAPVSRKFQALPDNPDDFERNYSPEMAQVAAIHRNASNRASIESHQLRIVTEDYATAVPDLRPKSPSRRLSRPLSVTLPAAMGTSDYNTIFQYYDLDDGRHREDEIPLTNEYTDNPRGFAVTTLDRIGEEEGEGSEESRSLTRKDAHSQRSSLSFGNGPDHLDLVSSRNTKVRGGAGSPSTGGDLSSAKEEGIPRRSSDALRDSGLEEMPLSSPPPARVGGGERPLWQQNR